MANKGPRLRILFFADTHLGFDFPLRPRVDMRRRGQGFFDNYQHILDYAAQSKPDLVVHGGDLFFRRRVQPKIVDMAYEALMKFAESGIPVFIVPGNHEGSSLPASLWLLGSKANVFDRPRTFRIDVGGQAVAISGFPFARNDAGHRFRALLAETGWRDASAPIKLLCLHQAVEGAQFGPSNFTFRAGKDVIRISDIPGEFIAVLTGHIHRRQILNGNRGNGPLPVVYAGSVERTSFAEKDEPKGFYEIELAPDEAGRWRARAIDFLELPTRPMVDLLIGPRGDSFRLQDHLRRQVEGLDVNSIVRLRCTTEPDQSILARLTAPVLRSVFPKSMNVQLGIEFRSEEQRGYRRARQ